MIVAALVKTSTAFTTVIPDDGDDPLPPEWRAFLDKWGVDFPKGQPQLPGTVVINDERITFLIVRNITMSIDEETQEVTSDLPTVMQEIADLGIPVEVYACQTRDGIKLMEPNTAALFPFLHQRHTYDAEGNVTGDIPKEMAHVAKGSGYAEWQA